MTVKKWSKIKKYANQANYFSIIARIIQTHLLYILTNMYVLYAKKGVIKIPKPDFYYFLQKKYIKFKENMLWQKNIKHILSSYGTVFIANPVYFIF